MKIQMLLLLLHRDQVIRMILKDGLHLELG
jgi:hypothetical protein